MSADAFPAHESTRKRRRWGCTCGCVGLLTVLTVIGIFVAYGFLRPHPTFPPNAMFDSSVNGYGVLRIDSTDEGEGELLKFLFRRIERIQVEGLSEGDAKLMTGFLKVLRQFITTMVQTNCPVYLSYDPNAQEESILTVVPLRNKLSYVLLRKFLTSYVSQPQDHKDDSDIYPVDKLTGQTTASVLAVSLKEFVYSDDLQLLNRSLDYRADANRNAELSDKLNERLDDLNLDKPPAGEDLALLFVNEPGRLEHLLHKCEGVLGVPGFVQKFTALLAEQKLSLDNVLSFKFSGDLVSVDRAKIEVTLYFRQADISAKFAAVLKTVLPQLSGKHEGSPFELRQDVRTRGIPVVISLDMSGIRSWLETIMPAPPAEPAKPGDAAAEPKAEEPKKE